MSEFYGVMCFWEWIEDNWKLFESFPIDGDGYALTNTKTPIKNNRYPGDSWIMESSDEDDEDPSPIMGRAVTLWSMRGLSLHRFNPPDYPKWISSSFYENLCKDDNWHSNLEKGYNLYFGTLSEAEKYISVNKNER